jgi:hypothetical protein
MTGKALSLGASVFAPINFCETFNLWPWYWCSPTTFFRIPLAHSFLNGLVKGFWQTVSRDKATDEKLTRGRDVILDCDSAQRIARNITMMHTMSSFASNFKNILQCGSTLTAAKEPLHSGVYIFRSITIVGMVETGMCRPNNKLSNVIASHHKQQKRHIHQVRCTVSCLSRP